MQRALFLCRPTLLLLCVKDIVLVPSGCCNEIPQSGQLVNNSSRGWKVEDQDVSMVQF